MTIMMKKITYILLTIILLSTVFAQYDDCPFGEVNEPYPGTCGRYTDTDTNDLCDHSEPVPTTNTKDTTQAVQPIAITAQQMDQVDTHDIITGKELKTKTVQEVATLYQIDSHVYAHALREKYPNADIHHDTQFQLLHDNYGLEPSIAKEVALSLSPFANEEQTAEPIVQNNNVNETKTESKFKERYPFLLLAIIIVGIYIASYISAKKKIISMLNHKKFWNYLLLISFLVTGISGIYLVLKINYGWIINFPFNVLYWHVEFGIVMSFITVFHILWHMYYFVGKIGKKK